MNESFSPPPSAIEQQVFVNRLRQGEDAAAIRGELIQRGLNGESADNLLRDLQFEAVNQEATALLNAGLSPEQVQRDLEGLGLTPETARAVVDGLLAERGRGRSKYARSLLRCLGAAVFICGVGLWIGNRTHVFPTFPFAGFLVMAIGGGIWNAADAR